MHAPTACCAHRGRRWLAALAALGLASCSVLQPAVSPSSPDAGRALYDAHAARVMNLSAWNLTGRVSVTSEQESWQATLHWRQSLAQFDVLLQGPLGQGSMRLRSAQGYVAMESSDGQRLTDVSAAQLIRQRVGWSLPVEELRYWVRGVAAPDSEAVMEWDATGQVLRLQQNGWDVRYKSYVAADGVMMPAKLSLAQAPWLVKLVVDVWGDGTAPVPGAADAAP